MTFGVNALDWTNIGSKLRTSMAETVGESLVATNLAAFSSMVGFIIYDGETGVKTTQYDMYIDRDEDEEGNPLPLSEHAITTKENEDGEKIVIDRTLIPNFYIGTDADGNMLITQDVSLISGYDEDEDGTPIPINAGAGGIQSFMIEEPIQEWAKELFDSIIDTDTSWSPDLLIASLDDERGVDYQTVDEVTNSDGTTWLRLKKRNGIESIFYYLPYSSETEYTTLVDSIPAEFTFADDQYLFPVGTELTAETGDPKARASTVEATSVSSTLLSSTYDTSLTDLNTAYEAVLSGDTTGGGNGGTTGGSDGCPDNATYNTTDAKSECDDGYKSTMTTDGSGTLLECNVTFMHNFTTTTLPKAKVFILDNKFWILGGGFVLLGGLGWISGLFRGSKAPAEEKQTLGQLLDNAIGSGKEIEG